MSFLLNVFSRKTSPARYYEVSSRRIQSSQITPIKHNNIISTKEYLLTDHNSKKSFSILKDKIESIRNKFGIKHFNNLGNDGETAQIINALNTRIKTTASRESLRSNIASKTEIVKEAEKKYSPMKSKKTFNMIIDIPEINAERKIKGSPKIKIGTLVTNTQKPQTFRYKSMSKEPLKQDLKKLQEYLDSITNSEYKSLPANYQDELNRLAESILSLKQTINKPKFV